MSNINEKANRWVEAHAPLNDKKKSFELINKHLGKNLPLNAIVVAFDIRKSTLVMKEAINFQDFSKVMEGFIESSNTNGVRKNKGWFDKFTGDGFIAYWFYGSDLVGIFIKDVFALILAIVKAFNNTMVDQFRFNSQNFPEGVGLSVGIDAGPVYLSEMGGDLTIVGRPVVGSVRMVSSSTAPGEIVINNNLGFKLMELVKVAGPIIDKYIIVRENRKTKEFESQEVYLLTENNS